MFRIGVAMSTQPKELGKYELRERLGRGGMAEVWKAFDTQLHRFVAIKLMHADLQHDPDFMSRFVREARAIASLHHPNIIQIYDFQTTGTTDPNSPMAYMVMDYVEGQTLADFMSSTTRVGKFLSANELVQMFAAISRAIDYAHKHGMIHRDIKPANILLDKRNTTQNPMGEPILSDFGIAKLMGVSGGTMQGTWLGTPMYAAPEQINGQPGDERSDLYSLGVILYELCTGVQPFRGDTITAVIVQQINTMPTAPSIVNPAVPSALSDVILRSLAKDPMARYGSASELTVAIAQALRVPVPSDMIGIANQAYDYDPMDAPTYLIPSRAEELPTVLSGAGGTSTPVQPVTPLGQPVINARANVQSVPGVREAITPPNASSVTALPKSPPSSPGRTPDVTPVPPFAPPPKKNRRNLLIALVALILLVVIGSSAGAFFLFNRTASPATGTLVGQVFFLSSGQSSTDTNNAGLNDQLEIDLHNLASPASGKSFYAWLLGDNSQSEGAALLVGTLNVSNGTVHFRYPGDAQHDNLLATYSRFLITQEDSNPTPIAPSADTHAWLYYAELPQTKSKVDNFSLLDHVRHLLAKDPELDPLHLPGGLEIWLYRNTQSVQQRAVKAKSCWQSKDAACIQHDVIRILDYLDGKNYVQQDVPQGTPLLIDSRLVSVGLLELDPSQNPPGYVYHINRHLQGIVQAPGATAGQKQMASQIDIGLNVLSQTLQLVRTDARQLMAMSQDELLSNNALSLLTDMATQADYAFNGQRNGNTNQMQGGAVQIYRNSQRLATFDVKTYTA